MCVLMWIAVYARMHLEANQIEDIAVLALPSRAVASLHVSNPVTLSLLAVAPTLCKAAWASCHGHARPAPRRTPERKL